MGTEERARLASRQFEIAALVAEGRTNREIALMLDISIHTVRNTLLTVYARTGVENRVCLARAVTLGQVLGPEAASPYPHGWAQQLPRVVTF